ncbi:MAG TPA: Gmad2 immunoglobulin-like domain-containing protein [Candidatus Paceibacterota bacterium]
MMSTKTWWTVIFVLFVGIVVMTGFLIALPSSKPSPEIVAATSTADEETPPSSVDEAPSSQPLSRSVVVTTPQQKQHVGRNFTVAGVAPGPWFFEAQFPMQVRDMEGSVVGRATATAQGEWMTEELVTFTAMMHIDATFHGEAILILMKDNPSGMPENDDAIEVPVVVD